MITCKECHRAYDYDGGVCPVCSAPPVIDEKDIAATQDELVRATSHKNAALIQSCRHLLADAGDTESEREYAKLLERSDPRVRDLDTAMEYYRRAAIKNDPFAAYRYSRLVSRSNERAAQIWLKYAAVLGCIESYPDASELFSAEGREDISAHYCALAAACDDTDSIVNMAKRWYEGTGVPQNEAYAKWYLDKMTLPPISAIKLAYKLRTVKSEEPPKLEFPEYISYLRSLCREADSFKFDTMTFRLSSTLAKVGDVNATTMLGKMLIEGRGCTADAAEGKNQLDSAIAQGSFEGAVYLGRAFIEGDHLPKDLSAAMAYFDKAASLGYTGAYEELGNIYHDGKLTERDIPRALELYELAATGGSATAREKAEHIKSTREQLFLDAYEAIVLGKATDAESAFNAFRSAAISTAMGETRAPKLLADCYARAIGTKQERSTAFYWYQKAVGLGDVSAYMPLAICYSRGFGTEFSYKDAINYLKIAEKTGFAGATEELNILYERRMKKMVRSLYSKAMRLIHMKKYGEAVRFLRSFESLGYPKALYTLGCMYEFGRGVTRSDVGMATKYYKLAFAGSPVFGNFADPRSDYKRRILLMLR